MLKKAVRAAWRILPAFMRMKVIRMTQHKFTVSAAVVVLNARNEVLLLNHVFRPVSGWGLPGGFIEKGEQPESGIRREIREETGIEIEQLRMIRVRAVRSHLEMLFTARSSDVPTVSSREILELGWFSIDGLPPDFSRAQAEIIRQVLNSEI